MEREENNSTVIYRNLHSKYTIYKDAYGLPTILDHCRISEISIEIEKIGDFELRFLINCVPD